MATQADVMDALKARVLLATANVTIDGVRIPRTVLKGWPARKQLEAGLQKGQAFVSVYMPPRMEKNTTRYFPFTETDPPPADLYVDQAGRVTEIVKVYQGSSTDILLESTSGTLRVGENVSLKVLRPILMATLIVGHQITAADTTATIVADLADKLNGLAVAGLTATSSANVLTVSLASPGWASEAIEVQIGTVGTTVIRVKTQQKKFWVIVWAPSAGVRDAFNAALDDDFGLFINADNPLLYNRLELPGGQLALANYSSSWADDREQEQKDWRQTFELEVEYSSYHTVPVSSEIVGVVPTVVIESPPSQNNRCMNGPTGMLLPFPASVSQVALDALEKLSIGGGVSRS
jgi:hypothetical protein